MGINCLLTALVSGQSRVPLPPARTIPFMGGRYTRGQPHHQTFVLLFAFARARAFLDLQIVQRQDVFFIQQVEEGLAERPGCDVLRKAHLASDGSSMRLVNMATSSVTDTSRPSDRVPSNSLKANIMNPKNRTIDVYIMLTPVSFTAASTAARMFHPFD